MARSAVGTFWLDLVIALGTSDFCQRGGDGTTIALHLHDSTFPPVASVTISDLRTDGWISRVARIQNRYYGFQCGPRHYSLSLGGCRTTAHGGCLFSNLSEFVPLLTSFRLCSVRSPVRDFYCGISLFFSYALEYRTSTRARCADAWQSGRRVCSVGRLFWCTWLSCPLPWDPVSV